MSVTPIRKGIIVTPPPTEPPAPETKLGIEVSLLLASACIILAGAVELLVEGYRWFEPLTKEHPTAVALCGIAIGVAGVSFAIQIAKRKMLQ